jgi:hypothetical protein
MITRMRTGFLALVAALSCLQLAWADKSGGYFNYQTAEGETVVLAQNRRPALYTGNFGDCLGDSTINVTRFDAAYYQDNMTVVFHLEGNTGVANDSLMMVIGVYAYGENRFELVFNPCNANIYSMCPLNASVPISANGVIPVNQEDVAAIQPIALSIPDFEGEAILRIFSNTTREQIACYSAVVTNGNSFGQPASVGTFLGVLTLIAMLASFATAAYGEAVPTMRLHYAHSLSVGVVFAVWQHIFFSGALSVNWPAVLTAWWKNFAWAGGMINTSSMQTSLNNFIGNDIGNTSQVGAAQSGSPNSGIGGGFDIATIYKRGLASTPMRAANHFLERDFASEIYGRDYSKVLRRDVLQRNVERTLQARDSGSLADKSSGYQWYGHPVVNGLPLPGNHSGFAGTLAEEGISASNAFLTGFLWFLILLVILVAALVAFKWALEGLVRVKWMKQERLKFFRDHWLGYCAVLALRMCYIGFFPIMFLTIFQFTYGTSPGAKGIAAIIFLIFFIGMPAVAGYAYWYKVTFVGTNSGRRHEHGMLMGKIPVPTQLIPKRNTQAGVIERTPSETKPTSFPLWKRMTSSGDIHEPVNESRSIHDDEQYTKKFGWLAARFRRTRWWFFSAWLFYEFLRAVFYGAASGYAQAQVFGLLVVEILAFGLIVWMKPFEGQRLNILVVYCLGFSKVTTVALSAAFDLRFNLQRITTTVIGIVIIVIQGILTIITIVAIIAGAFTSYLSVVRNRDEFRPRKWYQTREKYFDHLDRAVDDIPRSPKAKPEPAEVKEPKVGFELKNVKRAAKIEDEDKDFQSEINAGPMSVEDVTQMRSPTGTPWNQSRANSRAPSVRSISNSNVPYGARQHRVSWSTKDFQRLEASEGVSNPMDTSTTLVGEDSVLPVAARDKSHSRTPSATGTLPGLRAQPSAGSLRVGGDISTTDTIGVVPPPKVRPRAGTMGSVRSARGMASNVGDIPEGSRGAQDVNRSSENVATPSRSNSKRASYLGGGTVGSNYGRDHPLTPAQELDEWQSAELKQTISRTH